MAETIHKFKLDSETLSSLRLPTGATVLNIFHKYGDLYLYAMVDPKEKETVKRWFEIFRTGQDIPVDMGIARNYLQSVMEESGLVWHIFERIS